MPRERDFPPLLPRGTSGQVLTHNGTRWIAGPAGGGAPTTVGTLDSQTKSANGLVIVGNQVFAQTADLSYSGLLSESEQDIGGVKRFNEEIFAPKLTVYDILSGPDAGFPLVLWGGHETDTSTDDDAAVTVRNGSLNPRTRGKLFRVANSTNDITTPPDADEDVFAVDYAGSIVAAGSITATGNRRVLYADFTEVAGPTSGGTVSAHSYTVPANTLAAGKQLIIRAMIRTNGDANTKTWGLRIDGNDIRNIGVTTNTRYDVEAIVYCRTAGSQEIVTREMIFGSTAANNTSGHTPGGSLVTVGMTLTGTLVVDTRLGATAGPGLWSRWLIVEVVD